MMTKDLNIEDLKDDLKQLLIARFVEGVVKRSRIPNALRSSYTNLFMESHPVITQFWLVLNSNLDEATQAKFALKLLMYRDINPVDWISSWIKDDLSEAKQENSKELDHFVDHAVEPPLLQEIKERRHVKWLLRAVTSNEGRIVKRLNKLWTHLDLIKTAFSAKKIWMPLLQYTLTWRSDRKSFRSSNHETLLDTLQSQIDELTTRAAFEDFETFVEILSERYRGVGTNTKKKSNKKLGMDDRMRILRRVNFWSNYRSQTTTTRFIISPADYTAYHNDSLEELMLGDESIIMCEALPNQSPLMILHLNSLIIVSALTDSKQPTRFIPVTPDQPVHEIFSLQGHITYEQIASYIEEENDYYHKYLWQVLFTLILEGGGVSPDDLNQPFILGGDKLGNYVRGAGLKFTNQELNRQSSQLTELLKERPTLLSHLSDLFGEKLILTD